MLSPAFILSLGIVIAIGALTAVCVLGIERLIPWPAADRSSAE